jgi:hypothetical protein
MSKQLVQRQHQESLKVGGARIKGLSAPYLPIKMSSRFAESHAAILRGLSRLAAGAASAEQHLCARLHLVHSL